jgi:hypothetical protein
MSIRPVEFQVMIPKSPEVSRITNNEQQRVVVQQQQQSLSVQNNVNNSLKQVYSRDKANKVLIREKEREEKEKEKGKKQDKRNDHNEKRKNKTTDSDSRTIDIRI